MKKLKRIQIVFLVTIITVMSLMSNSVFAADGGQWVGGNFGGHTVGAEFHWDSNGYLTSVSVRCKTATLKEVAVLAKNPSSTASVKGYYTAEYISSSISKSSSYKTYSLYNGTAIGWHNGLYYNSGLRFKINGTYYYLYTNTSSFNF
jgi:hypothetical protein